MEVIAIIAFTVVIIVVITNVRDLLEKKYTYQGSGELEQIQSDLSELKKSVAEIREYVTDLYIQQNDKSTK